ncbi:segregation/condensation protein A [Jatrophihabitans sp. DSM 44399]|uniref:Segregation and condensation protein A n=2 Tax=Jatrophihabitans lederbergiae TaxID=3075547 RepID=A0ABU2JCU1_9ACTN|nr:segregation/condensation protein A [Jatrophihabitans sp. DSM 44399]MDT0262802.1 segregation/condensation protein A [Jatrophihabitans sp. DSM 44399]
MTATPAGPADLGKQLPVELEELPEQWDLPAEPEPLMNDGKFRVRLDNFEGPFDLLLTLIGRRQLDVTEVALSQVTDDFIGYLKAAGEGFDLGQATEFLVVAATLLELKAARLLPAADVDGEEDLALLEARDLLFARLLQYRAYKLVAGHLGELEKQASRRFGRNAELEPRFAALTPELRIGVDLHQFAAIAANALKPKPVPVVGVDHIHAPRVSVREHMAAMAERLARTGSATFRSLIAECGSTLEVVARFLGLLELYRDGTVAFDQVEALGELRIRWVGGQRAPNDDAGPDNASPEIDPDEEYGS